MNSSVIENRQKRYDSMLIWLRQQHIGLFVQAFGDLEYSILEDIANSEGIIESHEGGFIVKKSKTS